MKTRKEFAALLVEELQGQAQRSRELAASMLIVAQKVEKIVDLAALYLPRPPSSGSHDISAEAAADLRRSIEKTAQAFLVGLEQQQEEQDLLLAGELTVIADPELHSAIPGLDAYTEIAAATQAMGEAVTAGIDRVLAEPELIPAARNPNRRPTHPGEILREDVIGSGKFTVESIAEAALIYPLRMQQILDGKGSMDELECHNIGVALGNVSGELWRRMQKAHDEWAPPSEPEISPAAEAVGEAVTAGVDDLLNPVPAAAPPESEAALAPPPPAAQAAPPPVTTTEDLALELWSTTHKSLDLIAIEVDATNHQVERWIKAEEKRGGPRAQRPAKKAPSPAKKPPSPAEPEIDSGLKASGDIGSGIVNIDFKTRRVFGPGGIKSGLSEEAINIIDKLNDGQCYSAEVLAKRAAITLTGLSLMLPRLIEQMQDIGIEVITVKGIGCHMKRIEKL